MHAIKLQFVSIPRQRDSIKLLYTSFVCIILRIKESLKIPLSTKILCKDKPISIVFLISIMVLINIVFNFIDEMGGGVNRRSTDEAGGRVCNPTLSPRHLGDE